MEKKNIIKKRILLYVGMDSIIKKEKELLKLVTESILEFLNTNEKLEVLVATENMKKDVSVEICDVYKNDKNEEVECSVHKNEEYFMSQYEELLEEILAPIIRRFRIEKQVVSHLENWSKF